MAQALHEPDVIDEEGIALAAHGTVLDEPGYRAAIAIAAHAAASYELGDSPLTDDEYDAHVKNIAATERAHPEWTAASSPTQVVGTAVAGTAGDVKHLRPALSLDNVFNDAEITAWLTGRENRLGRPVGSYVAEVKIDGSAFVVQYRAGKRISAATRGDGLAGEDRTYALDRIRGLPETLTQPVNIEVRGEVFFRDADFERASASRVAHGKEPFRNPRNAAAGLLAKQVLDDPAAIQLDFLAYGYYGIPGDADAARIEALPHSKAMAELSVLGVSTAQDEVASGPARAAAGQLPSTDAVLAAVHAVENARHDIGFEIDGVVLKTDSADDRAELGMSSRAPRWAIAYKMPPEERTSTLLEVIWQIGRTGVITPRARVEPVLIAGILMEYATLHNPAQLTLLGAKIGDTVVCKRAGDVIPRIEAVMTDRRTGSETDVDIPQVCPRCGSDIDRSQERWRCERGRACGLAESIYHAMKRDTGLDIEGAGKTIVGQLVETGLVLDVADIFTLPAKRQQMLALERMGEASVDKILAEVEKARTLPLWKFFSALGIRGTGRSLSRSIAKAFRTMDAVRQASIADLMEVEKIGQVKAAMIFEELRELAPVLDRLAEMGIHPVEEEQAAASTAGAELPLTGRTVVVSGTVPGYSRTEAQILVEKLGGKASGSVSKSTSLLVAGDGAGGKVAKAESLGVEVKDPQWLLDLAASAGIS